MDEVSEEDNILYQESIEVLYYYNIWKNRLGWTRHVIPVRAYYAPAGVFVEGYLGVIPAIKKDYSTQVVEVILAYLPTKIHDHIYVNIEDIYPTARNLTLIKDQAIFHIEKTKKYLPQKQLSIDCLNQAFDFFKDELFTVPEIESMLNRNLTMEEKQNLVLSGKKNCLITSQTLDCFSNVEQKMINTDSVDLLKVKGNLSDLYQEYKDCTKCELGVKRKERCQDPVTTGRLGLDIWPNIKTIPSKTIMFIGEAPGTVEEATGIGFNPTAPAGGILDKVLSKAGLDQKYCYFTNAVLCRPEPTNTTTKNGKPTSDHISACSQRLKNELAIINPCIVVLLGKAAYRSFYGEDPKNILSSTGWQTNSKGVYLAPHPSFILRELSFTDPSRTAKVKYDYLNHFTTIYARYLQLNR